MKRISIQWDLNPRPQEFSIAGLCSIAVLQPHSVEKIKDSTLKNFEGKKQKKAFFLQNFGLSATISAQQANLTSKRERKKCL